MPPLFFLGIKKCHTGKRTGRGPTSAQLGPWATQVSSKWQGSIGLFERMEQLELQSDAVLASTAINAYGQARGGAKFAFSAKVLL